MIWLGIDPGLTGAIAVGKSNGTVEVWNMPETETDLRNLLSQIHGSIEAPITCWIEKVHAFPATKTDKSDEGSEQINYVQRLIDQKMVNIQIMSDVLYKLKNHQIVTRGVKATWTFAQHYGSLRQAIIDQYIPLNEISPKYWQPFYVSKSIKDRAERKKALKAKAQQLFPHIKVTLNNADALLIMDFARKVKYNEKPSGVLF